MVEAAANRFGALDILVNNAAHFALAPLLDATGEDALRFFGPNLFGPLQCSRAFARKVIASGRSGAIINVSSIASKRPAPGCGLYSATKAAVNALTRAWAVELAGTGVRVNAVAPGPVETPIFGKTGMTDEQLQATIARLTATVPIGRIGAPDEIATWVLHLADPSAAWVTGQIIGVDGGKSA